MTVALVFGDTHSMPGPFPVIELPVDDPILVFGLAMAIFLTAPLLLERYRLPGIVGIILVGTAIGPHGVGLLDRDETFVLLGEVGIVYLMFVAGLEINLTQFVQYKDRSIVFGLLSFVIPQAVGTIVGVTVLDLSLPAALLFAAIFSSHTLLAYPIVNRLGIAKNEAMTATIGGTILTDTLALLVLAVVVASVDGDLDAAFWIQLGIGLSVLFVGIWIVVPRVGRWFFRSIDQESYFDFLFVMVVLFASAYLAELIGVKHIVGAFLAGLALNRLVPETGPLMNRIEFVGNALFIPFFLLSVGMLVNIWALFEGTETVIITGSLLVLVVVTKALSAWVAGRIYGYTSHEIVGMFGLSVGQAAAALAIVLVGFEVGVPGFDQHMINGVVLMILVISVLSPALVERAGEEIRRARTIAPSDSSGRPQRILVPFSRESQYKEQLLDFALLVREERSDQPLYTLSVVPPGSETEATVVQVEESLDAVETYAAGAEVPVESRIRVDTNPASGIVSAVVENRITAVVIGWDGAPSRRQNAFGSVIDQVIRRTNRMVFVARVREPVNTTRRLVVVLPTGIEHSDGFAEVVHSLDVIANRTDASIRGIAVGTDADRFERRFAEIEPETQAKVETVETWRALMARLRRDVGTDDMVVCVSARKGAMGWHEELQRFPKRVSALTDGNFAVVYPTTAERDDDRRFLQFE